MYDHAARSCMIMRYIAKENIFVAFVYKLLIQKKCQNVKTLKTALKLMANKGL